MNQRLRTRANLIAISVVSAALIVYAVTQLVTTIVLDRAYPLYAEMPRAGGLLENKEVTYNGHPIGRVEHVDVTGTGVRVTMLIDEGEKVPHELDAVVLRRSPIGEQAVDLRPTGRIDDGTGFYEPGDTIGIRELTLPPEVQELFETATQVFEPIDKEKAGKLVGELADVVRGRREDLRSILRDSADFSESVADNGRSYDELWAAGRVVNAQLAESRDTLGGLIGELRDATSILTDMRSEFETLLVEAPPTLTLFGDLVERSQPNISCTIASLADLSEMTAEPENLRNAAEALRNNQFFFDGFSNQTGIDHNGHVWFRVHMEPPGGPPPESYLPDKRPIRDVLPGGACTSPFGPGAPSATQANYEVLTHDTDVDRPANDRRRAVRRDGTATGPAPRGGTPPAAVAPPGPLAGTGLAVVPLAVASMLSLGLGWYLSRRGKGAQP